MYFVLDDLLAVATRVTKDDPWELPVLLSPTVNGWECQHTPWISSDGLLLVFSDNANWTPRPGGLGDQDIWLTRRRTIDADWQQPVNVGLPVNTSARDGSPMISPDGSILYFNSMQPGGFGGRDIWQVSIDPVLDLNGDGAVDHEDVVLLTTHLGKDYPPCDIGPMPWGDGVVDMTDLIVLMKYTGETDTGWTDPALNPRPDALEIPRDVVLSWTSPEFVDSHDVYFGTSLDEVNNATRADPCGVLVSEGQTETTYDPEGLLEFSQTYYWRVDSVEVVIGSLEPTVYRGPVLKFTTEAYAYPIQNIAATASSSGVATGPEKTVDGSGLDENDGHSTDAKDMWQSKNVPPHWIEFEFDQVCTLHEMWVWNSNTELESLMSFGAKDVTIEYSTDGTTWATLDDVPEFAKAPGTPEYTANTIVSFGGVSAKYVKLTIEKGWGAMPVVGLSEVRFFYIPDRAYVTAP